MVRDRQGTVMTRLNLAALLQVEVPGIFVSYEEP